MTLEERIGKIRSLITQRDDIDRQIAECLGDVALSVRAPRGPKTKSAGIQRRPYKRKLLDSEVAQEAVRRHPATAEIEQMLIDG